MKSSKEIFNIQIYDISFIPMNLCICNNTLSFFKSVGNSGAYTLDLPNIFLILCQSLIQLFLYKLQLTVWCINNSGSPAFLRNFKGFIITMRMFHKQNITQLTS